MSRVIRGGGGRPRVVRAEVVDARAEAERIVEQARAEAERIVEQARAEGLEHARAEAAALLLSARQERDRLLESSRQELARVAVAAAERVVAQELALHPDRVRVIVERALEPTRRAERVELRVHPEDAELLERLPPNVEVVPDPAIARGGCLVCSERGEVDARIEVQLCALREALLGEP